VLVDNFRLVETAMLLRAAAPDSWEAFVKAMREVSLAAAAEMVQCPPENLQKAQGMAMMARDLAYTLQEAPKLYERKREWQMTNKKG
jgi:hypothetical protein